MLVRSGRFHFNIKRPMLFTELRCTLSRKNSVESPVLRAESPIFAVNERDSKFDRFGHRLVLLSTLDSQLSTEWLRLRHHTTGY